MKGFLNKTLIITCIIFIFTGCSRKTSLPDIKLQDNFVIIKNSKLYYSSNVSTDDLNSFEKYTKSIDFFNNDTIMRIDRSESGEYLIYDYVPKWVFTSNTQAEYFQLKANDFSFSVFNGATVIFYLCDDDFKPVVSFTSSK